MPFSDQVRSRLDADAARIISQYPGSRSALLPLLHLVQSEEGYVSEDGIEYCARQLGLTEADVTGVVTFYTMYKRGPVGEYHVGVCTNTVCGVLGGNQILAELHEPGLSLRAPQQVGDPVHLVHALLWRSAYRLVLPACNSPKLCLLALALLAGRRAAAYPSALMQRSVGEAECPARSPRW